MEIVARALYQKLPSHFYPHHTAIRTPARAMNTIGPNIFRMIPASEVLK
jgi:hypothetical protein